MGLQLNKFEFTIRASWEPGFLHLALHHPWCPKLSFKTDTVSINEIAPKN